MAGRWRRFRGGLRTVEEVEVGEEVEVEGGGVCPGRDVGGQKDKRVLGSSQLVL